MTTTNIPALLEPIQGRLDAATPGPWHLDRDEPGDVASVVAYASNDGVTIGTYVADTVEEDGDAEFIAHAPTDTARLLAAVKAVVAESGEVVADSEGLGLDFQEDDFDRGYHAARRQTVQQILDAVESALRGEA